MHVVCLLGGVDFYASPSVIPSGLNHYILHIIIATCTGLGASTPEAKVRHRIFLTGSFPDAYSRRYSSRSRPVSGAQKHKNVRAEGGEEAGEEGDLMDLSALRPGKEMMDATAVAVENPT